MKSAIYKKPLPAKKLSKVDREQAVLFGLVELYLKSGKPIGSHTLQENGFESLSSATIRNYFGKMEADGLLKQQHISGGRIPTDQAFRKYVEACRDQGVVEKVQEEAIQRIVEGETREVATFLNRCADTLSELTKCAVFVSAPRFDQDFIQDIRLIRLDPVKILSVLITDFGLIRTEAVYLDKEVDALFLRSAEEYFLWRMNKGEKPLFKDEMEAKLSQKIYNEVMVRHVVGYANFPEEDIIRTGLAKLLAYPEFNDASALANSLSLLEDVNQMRELLRKCAKKNQMISWIGNELCPVVPEDAECAVIAIPYRINQAVAGSIAILGPTRIPYRNLFGLLQVFSEQVSLALTKSLYKYKITFRQPTNTSRQIEVK
ncbi:MAG: heat-inducible transcription repressor HrcA [Chlamydiae bacterium RIFCSPHIGHO2_12_FULL_44_59]|nr:MAG: heat-inducible transcription repressor HrcA [Chlamydiae bacterium RIFCSPHIGHO2_01_FULL_44_39]OGN58195.1 MAG: heat-inducible transcription repressor HrcA [Chlamydiae bacterium RIFCSPHIGHO2_02_FULL_45_9]OGN60927.1 MAG: heat-inducible transcription repressor HrcA [Chlamydiae bacterium RIFCSPHIGHO2_12_FULL_44_59]OGN66527.1 MAG: heat-inducible transcription repressor HrcA [Chlamydiae bacterium RIFCSPLOWO2_01_FULL_44_52]OGN69570.1 MAG: heat-inducible transcription repressor HrcA [Chlamydiae b